MLVYVLIAACVEISIGPQPFMIRYVLCDDENQF